MIFKIIIGIAGIIGFFWLTRIRDDRFSFVTTLTLATSILLIFIPTGLTRQIGGVGLPIGVIMSAIYGILKRDLSREQKTLTLIISITVFVSQIGFLIQWENFYWTGLLMIIPLFGYLYIFVKGIKNFRTQFGFLTIIVSYAIARLALMVQQGI
jgi:hypothetical protein